MGYSVAIKTQPSAATIEEALISATTVWKPRDLSVPTLKYPDGSGFPSAMHPELVGCAPAIISMDNAAQHYSKKITKNVHQYLGCAITWGAIGHWEHRSIIERLFGIIEVYGFRRLPSTTGSTPNDPIKSDPVGQAIKLGITFEHLLDLIDVLVAQYNATPQKNLGWLSPLDSLKSYLVDDSMSFLPRRLPSPTVDTPRLGITIETRIVRVALEKGRRPYVEIDAVHYSNPTLANSFRLIGQKVRVHINDRNMCTVTAYLESGQELGTLIAQGGWSRTPHTREMRKEIMALHRKGEVYLANGEDPVRSLLEYYSRKSYQDSCKNKNKISKSATKLASSVQSSGCAIPTVDEKTHVKEMKPQPQPKKYQISRRAVNVKLKSVRK